MLRPFAHLRAVVLAPFAIVALLAALLMTACATEHVETRKECNHRCNVAYETCSERSFGGDTLNNCGHQDVSCNAMCPSR